ncbi:hypothetical protein KQI68_01715 [Peptoniphilus sp. MSJ-1]|uniref:Copper amine oxidase N-terminal domain n=1 Tax=Peptoniphilus ovalis TaxID=2841503 RepID=A0ABS6FH43_9FIRM|nr:hypothetical protein [Peptoniphilus ovalis]MBU5668550.1 hypothetical protein [Peptoniphilus ovalis]
MMALSTIFMSLALVVVSIFGALGENIKSMDFRNAQIEISGENISTLDGEETKDNFRIAGIKEGKNSNFNLKTKSYDLNYFYDGENTYFNREAVLKNAGNRADDSLKEVKEDYIKIKGDEAFGFEEKYNLGFIPKAFDLLEDEKFVDSVIKISQFIAKSDELPKAEGNSYKFDIAELLQNENLNSYISKNYKEVEDELIYILNKVSGDEKLDKKFLEEAFKEINPKDIKEIAKVFKGSYIVFKVNDSKGLDFDVEIKFSLNGENEKESMSYLIKANVKVDESSAKVEFPKSFKEVRSNEFSDFFLSTYSDLAVINLNINGENKNISYKKDSHPILTDDSIYVDRHVIDQIIPKDFKDVEFKEDSIKIKDKEIKMKDGLYPLRKIAEALGYNVEYTMGDAPRFYVDLNKEEKL